MADKKIQEELIIAGFGGQGVLTIGRLLAYAGMVEDLNVAWFPSYGPEMRGGTANCNVVISDELVGSPVVTEADSLIVMNGPSLDKFESHVKPGGKIFVNSSLVERKVSRDDVEAFYFGVSDEAVTLGNPGVANIIMLGAYMTVKNFPSKEAVLESFMKVFGESKKKFLPMNKKALARGIELAG